MSEHNEHEQDGTEHKSKHNFLTKAYEEHYKILMIFSVILVIFSFAVIGTHYLKTGDFVARGVSLTGGISLTLNAPANNTMTPDALQAYLLKTFPQADVSVMTFGVASNLQFSVEASGVNDTALVDALKPKFPNLTDADFANDKQTIGPTFGASFFTQTLKAIFIAFLFMSIVVFLYFGESTRDKWIASALTAVAATMMFYATSALLYILPLIIFVILRYGAYLNNDIANEFLHRRQLSAPGQRAGALEFRPAILQEQFRLGVHFLRLECDQSAGVFHRRQSPGGRNGRLRLAADVVVRWRHQHAHARATAKLSG